MKKILFLTFSAVLLNGCTNQDTGAITGTIAGGLIGSTIGRGSGQAVAIAAGALAGAYIGGSIGRKMDEQDRARFQQTLETNSIGQPAYWQNTRNGHRYEVVPVRNVNYDGNPYCREYRTTAYIGGKKQDMYGTACRQPDGSWQSTN